MTDATATIKVNGTTVASGASSGALALAVGTNPITTVVTAQDGSTTKTYTVTVTRAPSAIATLSGLALSSGTLSPAFSAATLAYTASVSNATTSMTLTPTVTDATATIKVNGTTVASGASSGAITLAVGTNPITVLVTAQDGTTQSTCSITVTRTASASSGYASWIVSYPGLADTTASGDPDHDGIPNLLEYVLTGNPSIASTAILPAVTKAAGNFVFKFSRRAASAQDTTQIFQYSTDLSHWTDAVITSPTDVRVALGVADANGVQAVTVSIPAGTNASLFGRLKVTTPVVVVTGYAAWIGTYTGLADASASGDPDHDGIPNLIEYAMARNPVVGTASDGPSGAGYLVTLSGIPWLHLDMPDPAMADVTYVVQGGTSLTGAWTPLARKDGIASWTWLGGDTSRISLGTCVGGRLPVEVGRPDSASGQPRYFLRLQATLP